MSRVRTSDLGAGASYVGLDAAAPGGRFRRSITLSIPTGGEAATAQVAPNAVFNVSFISRVVNAKSSGVPEPVTLNSSSNGLVLNLSRAREVHRVQLVSPVDGDRIAAFRFDGDAVSDGAVADGHHGVSGAVLNVSDKGLILRRRNGGDHALTPGAIAKVDLLYAPENPRVLLAVAGGEPQALPPVLDADGQPDFPSSAARGADLMQALNTALLRMDTPLPNPLQVQFILESNSPCRARIDALDLTLVLTGGGFLGAPGKRVLRFAGGRRETQSLNVKLPARAAFLGGAVSYSLSGTPAGTSGTRVGGDALPGPSLEGIALSSDKVIATRLELASALVINGADAILAATRSGTEVCVQLRTDVNGLPGDILSESEPVTTAKSQPAPIPFALHAVAVPEGNVWLGLRLFRGGAIALLGGTGLIATGDGLRFSIFKSAGTQGLAARLRSPLPDTAPEAVTISLAGTRLDLASDIDLTAALTAIPMPHPSSLSLDISADTKAVVTLKAPVLRYTLADQLN